MKKKILWVSFSIILLLGIGVAVAESNNVINLRGGIDDVVLEKNGGVPVSIQDQTSKAFDIFFIQKVEGTNTTLLNNAIIDTYKVNVTNVTNYIAWDYIGIFQDSEFYYAQIQNVTGNTLTLDTPLDFSFTSSAIVVSSIRNMNVDGSINRQIFEIPLPETSLIEIDITRILLQITCDNPPNFDSFCDIPGGVVNGIVLRRVDGAIQNYWNVKNNGEFTNLMYDLEFYYQTQNQQVNGIGGRMSFGGQDKHGVTIRLAAGESLQLLIHDDLSSLLSFTMIAEGHVVID